MRKIEPTTQFKKDYKRERRGQQGTSLEADLKAVFDFLCDDLALPEEYQDHQLSGKLKDFRDCHIHPDLILIYRKQGATALQLVRLGSHSQLNI